MAYSTRGVRRFLHVCLAGGVPAYRGHPGCETRSDKSRLTRIMLAWKSGEMNAPLSLCHRVASSLPVAAEILPTSLIVQAFRALSQEAVKLSGTHFPQLLLYVGMRNVSRLPAQIGSDFGKIGAKVCNVSIQPRGNKLPAPAYLRKTTIFRRWFDSLRPLHLFCK